MLKNKKTLWVAIGCLVATALIFVFSFIVAPKESTEGENFGGTDGAVTTMLEEDAKVEPWFDPIIDLGSGELESGLFALQAALGAGILCFALGSLHGRRKASTMCPAKADAASK